MFVRLWTLALGLLLTALLAVALVGALRSARRERRRAGLYRAGGERLAHGLDFYADESIYAAPFPIARDRGAWARRVLRGREDADRG